MPLLKIQTNVMAPESKVEPLLKALTDLVVRDMDKPKSYVQVVLEPRCAILLGGTDQPSAFVELRALGLTEDQAKPLSASISQVLQDHLGISPERVFINFFDIPRALWGWNSSTFA